MEQASAKKAEAAREPVDPALSRFGVRQAFDLIDLLSSFGVAGAAREAVIEEIRAYASGAVAGAEAPRLAHGQVLVAHVEHGPDGPVVAALETHGVTTKNPATHARKASKKH